MAIKNLGSTNGIKNSIALDGITYTSDMQLITTTTLGADTSSITFSNLDTVASEYKHLRVVLTGRAGTNSTGQSINLKINGSTSSIYNSQSFYAFSGASNRTWIYINQPDTQSYIGGCEGQTAYPSIFQPNIYEFPNFSSTSINKYYQCLGGCAIGPDVANGSSNVSFNNGMWASTAAITTIQFVLATNFKSGTRASLYGLRG